MLVYPGYLTSHIKKLLNMTARHLTPYHRERADRDQIRFLARLTLAVSALAAYVGGLHATGVL